MSLGFARPGLVCPLECMDLDSWLTCRLVLAPFVHGRLALVSGVLENKTTPHDVHETVAKPKTVSQRVQAGVALGSVDHSPTSRAHTRAPYSSTQHRLHSLPTRAHATPALWLTTLTHSRTTLVLLKTPVRGKTTPAGTLSPSKKIYIVNCDSQSQSRPTDPGRRPSRRTRSQGSGTAREATATARRLHDVIHARGPGRRAHWRRICWRAQLAWHVHRAVPSALVASALVAGKAPTQLARC